MPLFLTKTKTHRNLSIKIVAVLRFSSAVPFMRYYGELWRNDGRTAATA